MISSFPPVNGTVLSVPNYQWCHGVQTPKVRQCCNGEDASQWKSPKFGPSSRQNLLTDLYYNWHSWLHCEYLPAGEISSRLLWRSMCPTFVTFITHICCCFLPYTNADLTQLLSIMSVLTFVALFRLTFVHFYVTIRGELEIYAEILLGFKYLMKSTCLQKYYSST